MQLHFYFMSLAWLRLSSIGQSLEMVRTSNIREKVTSNALKELARERGLKRKRDVDIDKNKDQNYVDDEDGGDDEAELNRHLNSETRSSKSKLLSILPKPKKSSIFGPSVKLDKLLRMPDRAETNAKHSEVEKESVSGSKEAKDDDILEVDVSRVVGEMNPTVIRDLTIVKPNPVIIPKGKEKQKNQITYLAQLGKANELERQEQAALGRLNKAAARSKYGW